jgi:hypothetical protein
LRGIGILLGKGDSVREQEIGFGERRDDALELMGSKADGYS